MEYGQIFHVTRIGKYYCKNMKYRINIFGERSEPLSRVFNDQPRGIYIYNMVESVRTYVSNRHAHVRMSVCY